MGKILFITGTGTDVGKSTVSLAVSLWARSRSLGVAYCKPVQCGTFPFGDPPSPHGDAEWVQAKSPGLSVRVTYRYENPVSPHLAAEWEETPITPERIRADLHDLKKSHDLVVLEGVGGAAVPLDRRGTSLAALVTDMALPSLLVCAPGMGTLHHTLATFAYLRSLTARMAGFVFCHCEPLSPSMAKDNIATLGALTGMDFWGEVPHCPGLVAPGPLDSAEAETLMSPLLPSLDRWWKQSRT